MYNLSKVMKVIESNNLDCLLLVGSPNIKYLIRSNFEGSIALITKDGSKYLITPFLDLNRALNYVKGFEIYTWASKGAEGYDVPSDRVLTGKLSDVLINIIKREGCRVVGIDMGYMEPGFKELTERLGKEFTLKDVTKDILNARMIKESDEVSLMRKALEITEGAIKEVVNEIKDGMTELEVAGLLEYHMRKLGAEWFAFPTIVAYGINSSYPHAFATSQKVGKEGPIVMDLGAVYSCYSSDITRTITLGNDPELRRLIEVVAEAMHAGIDRAGPGVKASEVDKVVREFLSRHGLKKYFIHSTGHGVGIEVHEPPRLSPTSDTELKPGMVVTVEPGIYIRSKYGIRVENMVLITKGGAEVLNKLPEVLL